MFADLCNLMDIKLLLIIVGGLIFSTFIFQIGKNNFKFVLPLKTVKTVLITYLILLVLIPLLPIIFYLFDKSDIFPFFIIYFCQMPLMYFFILNIVFLRRVIKKRELEEKE